MCYRADVNEGDVLYSLVGEVWGRVVNVDEDRVYYRWTAPHASGVFVRTREEFEEKLVHGILCVVDCGVL